MGLDPCTDEHLQLLADTSNRAIMTILDDTRQALTVEEVAERLVDHNVDIVSEAEYEQHFEETLISLHHHRLPKLADAGLLKYDHEATIVRSRDTTGPADAKWHEVTSIADVARYLGTDYRASEGDIGVLEGRQSVIEYGRQLADEAREELFCMYVSTDLLEKECVRRAQKAVNRGVTMYMGSQNPEVRELTRQHLPEATIWEPQLDWLNTPTYPRVGRLVLIDRRKVMLAILEESSSDSTNPGETAVVAEGEDHPIVVLVRELLGARIDHLDFQSDEFTSELPS